MRRSRDASISRRRGGLVLTAALLLAAGTGVPALADGPTAGPVTLADALQAVGSSSHAAEVAKLELAAARQGTRAARASELPKVDIGGGFTDRDSELVAVFGPFTAPLGDDTYWSYQVSAKYLLWDGGVRASAIKAALAMEEVAARGGASQVVVAQLAGLGSYLRAMMAKAKRRAVRKRIDAVKGHLAVVRNLYDQGIVARNDLLETEVRLRRVQDADLAAADDLAVAVRSLARLMGRDPAEPVDLPPALGPPAPLSAGEDELVRTALAASPEIKALSAKLEAAQRRAELSRRDGMPQVFAQVAHTYEENPYLLHPNANVLFLGLSWNVFDGGARTARRRATGIGVATAQRDLEEARRRVKNQVDAAFRAYRRALREAKTAETNVKAAEENLRIEEDQYRVGMVQSSDVLDAEAVLAESRFALISRHYGAYLQQGTLLAVTGRDLVDFYRTPGGKTRREGGSS